MPPSVPPDHALPLLLADAFAGLMDALHDRLADRGYAGVTTTHGFALRALGQGCTAVELGRRLGVSKQAAGRTAQSLEELGLVQRCPDPADARARVLVPTERARAMLDASGQILLDLVARWRGDHGDAAVDTVLRVLAGVAPGRPGPRDPAGPG